MNGKLIENLILSNNENCPEFTYSNPLLDKNVTTALSKSFLKILNISKEDSSTNKKARHVVLENIRKMCNIEPDEHGKVDENLTELLTGYYENQIQDNNSDSVEAIDRKLDAFLIRRSKEISINSSFRSIINPEVAQALINLNEESKFKDALSQDIIHWNSGDERCLKILKELWKCDETHDLYDDRSHFYDDTSIKIKTEIEKSLLDISYELLHNDSADIEDILTNDNYNTLISTCAVSAECFQICINVLNTLFFINNFHSKIQNLIVVFVQKVKISCSKITFAILYPTHLRHLVTLLDIDLDVLPPPIKLNYVQTAINYLKELQKKSESDLILLLLHFPQWFNIYFEQ